MIKSRGLRTDPCWTPTLTSNSSLYSEPTLTQLRALLYIACTRHTIHSTTPTFSHSPPQDLSGDTVKRFLQINKSKEKSQVLVIEIFPGQEFLLELGQARQKNIVKKLSFLAKSMLPVHPYLQKNHIGKPNKFSQTFSDIIKVNDIITGFSN